MQENTVSVLEAAKFLGVGRDTVYRLVKAERLSAHRKTHAPQSPFMIDRASLEAYDRARRAPVSNPKGCDSTKRQTTAPL
jgi:excisionase family DNA binding protein